MNSKKTIFSIFIGVLILAFISQISLSSFWHDVTTRDRVFTSLILLDLVSAIPISWPFAVGGALIAGFEPERRIAFFLTLILGGIGSALYFYLYRIEMVVSPMWSYSIYLKPVLVAFFGFVIGSAVEFTEQIAACNRERLTPLMAHGLDVLQNV